MFDICFLLYILRFVHEDCPGIQQGLNPLQSMYFCILEIFSVLLQLNKSVLAKNYRFELLLEPLASKQSHSIKDSQLYFKVGIRCFTLYAVPFFFFSKHAGCVQGQKVLFTCHLATTYSCRFSGLFSSILFVQTF